MTPQRGRNGRITQIGAPWPVRVVGIGGTLRPNSTSLGALKRAVAAAAAAGADTQVFDLRELALPFYEPDRPLDAYGENVRRYLAAVHDADGLLIATAAYQGTLAGVTKNAIDFLEFLADASPPYLDGKAVGLIATAAGSQAAPNAIAPLVQATHALRAVAAPFSVPIPETWKLTDANGDIVDPRYQARLDDLGRMVVDLARRLRGDGIRHEPATTIETVVAASD
ncbi:MAG: NAD(P)H-dependent oxidoreductase [Thermomicrobiales bacterium]|nr:NAD(P)H-dependent oxidoreductase [Thermomicrobiales bacterium]